jgi:hypothetical protein
MKWFFILLLLINALYFGWELDRQTKLDVTNKSSLPPLPKQAERLRFLNELEALPPLREVELDKPVQTTAAITPATSLADEQEESGLASEADIASELVDQLPDIGITAQQNSLGLGACFSFGPIADEIQANGLSDWFASNGGQAQLRHTDEQGRQLFWVYLSPQDSRQDAMETIKSFRNKGIRDFRLIVKGNMQNAISMGLFSSQAAVNSRLRELQKKGYKPVVVPYSDGKRAWWVDAKLSVDKAILDKVFNDYPSRFNSVPVKCTEIAIESEYS